MLSLSSLPLETPHDMLIFSDWPTPFPLPVNFNNFFFQSGIMPLTEQQKERFFRGMDPQHEEKARKIMQELLANPSKGKAVRKKKKKQQKLKEGFTQRNFQKYLLKQCVFDKHLKDHVFEPPKYQQEFDSLELTNARCCDKCYLRPCLMEGKKNLFLDSLKDDYEDPEFALQNNTVLAGNLFLKYCGKLWVKRMKIATAMPACVGIKMPALLKQAEAEAVAVSNKHYA